MGARQSEVCTLIERNGERLLERNVRRYLGRHGNRVNEGIRATLLGEDRSNFYFYNNGITLTCDKFSYNGLQSSDYQVNVENLHIINGGQTCMTIYKTLRQLSLVDSGPASVLLRLYQLPSDNEDLVQSITYFLIPGPTSRLARFPEAPLVRNLASPTSIRSPWLLPAGPTRRSHAAQAVHPLHGTARGVLHCASKSRGLASASVSPRGTQCGGVEMLWVEELDLSRSVPGMSPGRAVLTLDDPERHPAAADHRRM